MAHGQETRPSPCGPKERQTQIPGRGPGAPSDHGGRAGPLGHEPSAENNAKN